GRVAADAEVEALAGQLAARDASRRAAAQRVEEAQGRVVRTRRALDQARNERAALGVAASPQAAEARTALEAAEAALAAARAALDRAEEDRARATEGEAAAREASRKLDDQLGRLTAEARALAGLVAQARRGGFAPALDAVAPE